ncbi:MAG: DUF6838 family protein, partial [Lachnospirales bacterium]
KAVADKLKSEFPENEIYVESVKQGFKIPCFSILPLEVSDTLFRHNRYKYRGVIEVRYYCEDREDMVGVCEKLFNKLNEIYDDNIGRLFGSNMKSEFGEDFYKFVVEYEFYYIKNNVDCDVMGSVNLELKL